MTKDELAKTVGYQANWREEKAREHPHDAVRNLDAAKSLRELSESISAMSDAEFERLYYSRFNLVDESVQLRAIEVERELLSSIHFSLKDAREFFAFIFDEAGAPEVA